MADCNGEIAAFRMRAGAVLAVRAAVPLCALWCLAWGTAVIALRFGAQMARGPLLWGLAGVGAAVAAAAWLAARRVPSLGAVRALLDARGHCGGLLAAAGEVDLGPWRDRLPAVRAPALRWRGGRQLGLLAAAAAFLCATLAVPDRYFAPTPSSGRLDVSGEAQRLAHQIETLQAERILQDEKAQAIQEKLRGLSEQARGDDPVRTWESLDHLENAVAQAAQDAAESAIRRTDTLAQAEELASALQQAATAMSPSDLSEAMKELAERVGQALQEHPPLAEALPRELAEGCRAGTLSPEQLGELSRRLGQCNRRTLEGLERLCEAGLVDQRALAACQQAGQCDANALAALLCRCAGGRAPGDANSPGAANLTVAAALDARTCERPGQGGVTRGRGDAPLTAQAPASAEGVSFKEQVIPPSQVGSLKDSRLIGVSVSDPRENRPDRTASVGALGGAEAGAGSAHAHQLLPEHKGVVQRYFDRTGK